MANYDFRFENDRLRVATINHGIIHFQFGDAPVSDDLTEEEKQQVRNENADRAEIKKAIANQNQLHKFVDYVGENPNTAFSRFAGELPGKPR